MKIFKRVLAVLAILVVLGIMVVELGPNIFWAIHAHNTEKLASKATGLEAEYGQDAGADVKEFSMDVIGNNANASQYIVFYPAELESSDEKYPVVVWGNGTGNTYENYEPALRSLASCGFIVMGCDDSNMGDGKTLYDMAIFARDMNAEKDGWIFSGKIDEEHIGVGGHSQGACGAVNAATNYEESKTLFASLFTTSLPKMEMCVDSEDMKFGYWAYDMSAVSMPYFATTGTLFLDSMWISPISSMEDNFAKLPKDIEAYGASQKGANHNIVNEYHGCGYFNAWFCYTLKGDEKAAQVFKGEQELAHNKGWKIL